MVFQKENERIKERERFDEPGNHLLCLNEYSQQAQGPLFITRGRGESSGSPPSTCMDHTSCLSMHFSPTLSVPIFFHVSLLLFFLTYSLPTLMGSIALFKWAFLVCSESVPNASVFAPSDWPWIRLSLMNGCDGAITASKSCFAGPDIA